MGKLLDHLFNWKTISVILSVWDKEAREIIHRIAAGVPENSVLRSGSFVRVFDVIRQMIGETDIGPLKPLIEKLVDYGDKFSDELSGHETEGGERPKVEAALQGWMNKFFAEAGPRLKDATDKEAEYANLEAEWNARMKLLALMEEAAAAYAKSKEPPKEPPKPVEPLDLKIGEGIQTLLTAWDKNAQSRGYIPRRRS